MSSTVTKPRGRHFFANPGPTNIPDSVLRAIDRPSIDFHDPDFREVYDACFEGVKRVLRTNHRLFMYTGSGHGAWEASLTNLLSPGDTILLLESGYFSDEWAKMAKALKVEVRAVACDWRHGVDIAAVKTALAEDAAHAIKAVCVVHNETATGMFIPVPEVRAAIDATKHPALLLVDTISSLGSLDFRMDEWKIDYRRRRQPEGPDAAHRASASPRCRRRAWRRMRDAKLGRYYFDWTVMLARNPAELRRHHSGELLLRPEGVAAPARGGRAAQRVRPPSPAWRGGAARGAGLGRATTVRNCSAPIPAATPIR